MFLLYILQTHTTVKHIAAYITPPVCHASADDLWFRGGPEGPKHHLNKKEIHNPANHGSFLSLSFYKYCSSAALNVSLSGGLNITKHATLSHSMCFSPQDIAQHVADTVEPMENRLYGRYLFASAGRCIAKSHCFKKKKKKQLASQ